MLVSQACGSGESTAPTPRGSVEVTTATTGGTIDPDGYTVAVGGGTHAIAANATLAIGNLGIGSQSVALAGVANNCILTGDNPRSVMVTEDVAAKVTLAVQCAAVLSDKIVFASDRDGADLQLYTMNPDGTEQTRLTSSAYSDAFPAVTPNGRTIFFASNREAGFQIFAMSADGTNARRLTDHIMSAFFPAVSRDGDRVAFASPREGQGEIYLVNADGTGFVDLTDSFHDEGNPSWSPDGERIAFDRLEGDREIFVMNVTNGGLVNLTVNDAIDDMQPAWSPDGTRIAFVSDRNGAVDIWIMNVDGSNPVNLTQDQDNGVEAFPSWSPDGLLIAFSSNAHGNEEIYTINPDGTGRRRLTVDDAHDVGAAFSPVIDVN